MPVECTIWKYPVPITGGAQVHHMPKGARVVHVGQQNGGIVLWAEVFPHQPMEARRFQVYETGHEIAQGDYVGTVMIGKGVWHVYEAAAP